MTNEGQSRIPARIKALLARPGRRSGLVGVVLLIAAVAVLFLQGWATSPSPADVVDRHEDDPDHGVVRVPEDAQKNIGLRLAKPSRRSLERVVAATGIVSPDQARYAHIRPLGRGIVEKVYVQLGDRVRKGQPMVGYDNIELGELIGEYLHLLGGLEKLEAEREVARKILDRAIALLEVEAISRQEYEIRSAEYEQAEASVQSQRAELARVEEKLHRFGLTDADIAALRSEPHETLHRTSSHNVLRAPFDGVVTTYDVSPGELVDRDDTLFTLVDTSTVWVLADIYEKDIANVGVGHDCRIEVASYPGKVFVGRLTYLSDFLDPASRTAEARCVVPNEDARLKLEMFATVTIPFQDEEERLTVPIAALQTVGPDTVVFVRTGPETFERRVVTVGERSEHWAVIGAGLRGDESVVTEGSFYLKSILLREQIGDEH